MLTPCFSLFFALYHFVFAADVGAYSSCADATPFHFKANIAITGVCHFQDSMLLMPPPLRLRVLLADADDACFMIMPPLPLS